MGEIMSISLWSWSWYWYLTWFDQTANDLDVTQNGEKKIILGFQVDGDKYLLIVFQSELP